jgi:hypothetical protein
MEVLDRLSGNLCQCLLFRGSNTVELQLINLMSMVRDPGFQSTFDPLIGVVGVTTV